MALCPAGQLVQPVALFNPLWVTSPIDAVKATHRLLKTNWHQVQAIAQRAFRQRALIAAELIDQIGLRQLR